MAVITGTAELVWKGGNRHAGTEESTERVVRVGRVALPRQSQTPRIWHKCRICNDYLEARAGLWSKTQDNQWELMRMQLPVYREEGCESQRGVWSVASGVHVSTGSGVNLLGGKFPAQFLMSFLLGKKHIPRDGQPLGP